MPVLAVRLPLPHPRPFTVLGTDDVCALFLGGAAPDAVVLVTAGVVTLGLDGACRADDFCFTGAVADVGEEQFGVEAPAGGVAVPAWSQEVK